MLCSSACGGESDSEAPEWESRTDPIDPATLDCNTPVPEQFIAAMGGAVEAAPPVPDAAALESMGVVELGTQDGHSLLAIDPQVDPYKVSVPEHCVPLGQEFVATLKICVDAAGTVSGVTFLMNALPIIDSQLPYVIARWRFDPYLVEGRATPFCYVLNYRVR
jgi:hypothetical protein